MHRRAEWRGEREWAKEPVTADTPAERSESTFGSTSWKKLKETGDKLRRMRLEQTSDTES